jgi:hypothetical protein
MPKSSANHCPIATGTTVFLGAIVYMASHLCPGPGWSLVSTSLAIAAGLLRAASAGLPERHRRLAALCTWLAATLGVCAGAVMLP